MQWRIQVYPKKKKCTKHFRARQNYKRKWFGYFFFRLFFWTEQNTNYDEWLQCFCFYFCVCVFVFVWQFWFGWDILCWSQLLVITLDASTVLKFYCVEKWKVWTSNPKYARYSQEPFGQLIRCALWRCMAREARVRATETETLYQQWVIGCFIM